MFRKKKRTIRTGTNVVYKPKNLKLIYTLIWNASRCNLELERILGELADDFLSPDVSENLAGGGI